MDPTGIRPAVDLLMGAPTLINPRDGGGWLEPMAGPRLILPVFDGSYRGRIYWIRISGEGEECSTLLPNGSVGNGMGLPAG